MHILRRREDKYQFLEAKEMVIYFLYLSGLLERLGFGSRFHASNPRSILEVRITCWGFCFKSIMS